MSTLLPVSLQQIAYSINSNLLTIPPDDASKRRMATRSATGWRVVHATCEQLAAHLDSGAAIGALYRDGRRNEPDTIGVQYVAVDLDSRGDLAALQTFLSQHPLFGRIMWIIGATPSSTPAEPRARVFFPLAEPMIGHDLKQYAGLARRVLSQFIAGSYDPDQSSASASRFYFGYQLGTAVIHFGDLLTVDDLQALPAAPSDSAERIGDQLPAPHGMSGTRSLVADPLGWSPGATRARRWHDENMQFIEGAALGDQNNVLYWSARRSAELVAAGYFGVDELHRDALNAATAAGYVQRDGQRATLATIESAIRAGLTTPRQVRHVEQRQPVAADVGTIDPIPALTDEQLASAEPVAEVLPVAMPGPNFETFDGAKLIADEEYNERFVSPVDFYGDHDVLLKSDMGTGKTTAASRAIRGARRVLVITYRVALAEALARGFETECYKGLTAPDVRQIDRLTCSIQSLYKLVSGDDLPAYDVVIVDEIEKVLAALGGNTLRGDKAHFAYELLKSIVQRAGRVLAMDAHASPVAQQFLIEQRGADRVRTIINHYQRPRGALIMYDKVDRLTAEIEQLADESSGAPVMVVTNSEREAKRLEKLLGDRYGDHEVFAVYGENSGDPERQAVIRDLNRRIGNYRVFITSPSLDSGIDIQADVRAVVGIFYCEPLTAPECHQMLNRARNAREYHVYVQNERGDRLTDPGAIFHNGLQNAEMTAKAALFNAYGVPAVEVFQRGLHGLLSRIEAQANASKNRLYDHFLTLATGYQSITLMSGDDPALAARRKVAAEFVAEQRKAATLRAEPVDQFEYQQLQTDGKATPAVRAGFTRWLIERAAGRVITPELYDQLHKAEQRAGLTALRDFVHSTHEDMQERDRDNARARIRDRRHYTRKRGLLGDLLMRLYGRAGLTVDELEAEQVRQAVADFSALFGDELYKLFGRRADKSGDPVAILRWLMGKLGLKLTSRQVMRDGERRRVYRLDPEQLAAGLDLAATSYARYLADKAERAERPRITQNRDFSIFAPPGFEERRIVDGSKPPAPPAPSRSPAADLPYLHALTAPLH